VKNEKKEKKRNKKRKRERERERDPMGMTKVKCVAINAVQFEIAQSVLGNGIVQKSGKSAMSDKNRVDFQWRAA